MNITLGAPQIIYLAIWAMGVLFAASQAPKSKYPVAAFLGQFVIAVGILSLLAWGGFFGR